MKRIAFALMIGAGTSVASAQQGYDPDCRAPQYCAPPAGVPNCDAPRTTMAPPSNDRSAPNMGYYARSQASGEYAGESSTIGIRGLEVRLPEIRLALPEFRLPSMVHYRRNPEMLVDQSRAPWLDGPAMELNAVGPAAPRTAPVTPPSTPRTAPSCNGQAWQPAPAPPSLTALQQQLEQQQLMIAQLQQSLIEARGIDSRTLPSQEQQLRLARLALELELREAAARLEQPASEEPQFLLPGQAQSDVLDVDAMSWRTGTGAEFGPLAETRFESAPRLPESLAEAVEASSRPQTPVIQTGYQDSGASRREPSRSGQSAPASGHVQSQSVRSDSDIQFVQPPVGFTVPGGSSDSSESRQAADDTGARAANGQHVSAGTQTQRSGVSGRLRQLFRSR